MGILNSLRINFWGGIQTNVCVANNTQYDTSCTDSQGQPVPLLDLVHGQVNVHCQMTDEQIIDKLRSPTGNYYTLGGWNYYGDHLLNFVDAGVSSFGLPGAVALAKEGDLLHGAQVFLLGSQDPVTKQPPPFGPVMVDLDPTSGTTTQIYVGGLMIRAGNGDTLLHIAHDTVCHSRNLNRRLLQRAADAPGSSVVNGTFQVTFPTGAIVTLHKSLEQLMGISAGKPDTNIEGIVLRFSMFEMAPYMTTDELRRNYASNENGSNPSSGRVIGTIGLAYTGEPGTCPPGRLLVNQTLGVGLEGYAVSQKIGANTLFSIDGSAMMIKAKFRAERKAFTPTYQGRPTPIEPNIGFTSGDRVQLNFGVNSVVFPADSADYYLYGGIYDIDVSQYADDIWTNPVVITGTFAADSGVVEPLYVVEQPIRVIADARNVYLNDTADGRAKTFTARVGVTYLGGSLQQATNLSLTTASPGSLDNPKYLQWGLAGQASNDSPTSINVAAGLDSVELQFTYDPCKPAGFENLNLQDAASGASDFFNFRVYPPEDYSQLDASWENVYAKVLRFYYVTFPAMSKRIPLNDEGTIRAVKPQILARTGPSYRPTTLYMPITRSMTPGQIAFLKRYLQSS